jgi:mannose-6-phosphate isomerase-like protein (cupin superfamily)
MPMFHVSHLDQRAFVVPHPYLDNSHGYTRAALMDRALGSVHMGAGICKLAPTGRTDSCMHAYEKGIYLLEGRLQVRRGKEEMELAPDDYVLVPYGIEHALRNTGTADALWFEMNAPQPKPRGGWADTIFTQSRPWPDHVAALAAADRMFKSAARFVPQNARTPPGGAIKVYRFMEKEFGAHNFFMMRGELAPGGRRGYHDHPLEELYFVLSGEAYMDIEGERFHLRPGSIAWTGVGACHAFSHTGTEPFRWLETQAPQFPAENGTRNYDDWESVRRRESQRTDGSAGRSS